MSRPNNPIRVAIIGPESTGKTWLAHELGKAPGCGWVPEYAREYLAGLNRPYTEEDVISIAIGQQHLEDDLAARHTGILYCDTNAMVCKIWLQHVFQSSAHWIEENVRRQQYDAYLLCDVDLPWQPDPLREHPHERGYLFSLYLALCEDLALPFGIVRGLGEARKLNAEHLLQQLLPGEKKLV